MEQLLAAGTAGFTAALLVAVFAIGVLRRHARRFGLVDRPGGRKQHQRPTPVVGGLGMAIALAAALPIVLGLHETDSGFGTLLSAGAPFAGALLGLLLFGLVDDQRGLGSAPKFGVQVMAALVAVFAAGLALERIGIWPGGGLIAMGFLAAPVAVIAIVGFVNAFKMIDGVDGLAGSTAVVMLAALGIAAWVADAASAMLIAATLCGACLGFLVFNLRTPWRPRATVFLGDAGTLMLGFAIAWVAIDVSQRAASPIAPVGIAWVLALPVIDTLNLMIRRLMRGQSPFHADRNHLHHILGRAGFTPGQTAMIFSGLTLVMAVIGLAGSLIGVPDVLLGLALLLVASAHYFFVRYAWRTTKAIRRLRGLLARSDADRLPVIDRMALVGIYTVALALPAGRGGIVGAGVALIGLASLAQRQAIAAALRGLAITRLALMMAAWMTLAVFLRPEPLAAVWLPVMWMTGAFALPLGWWLGRYRHHALPLFSLAVASLIGTWALGADWQMLEAGYLRTADHWGSVQTGGLLLVLMLMVLVGAGAYGITSYTRRWRARASLVSAVLGVTMLLLLLLGLSLQSAVAAGLVGLVAMVVAAMRPGEQRALRVSVVGATVVTILLGSLLANTFKPPGVSLDEQYWGPVQAAFLYLGGATTQAETRYPGVASRLADWRSVVQASAQRPLAGDGRPFTAEERPQGALPTYRSAYASLLLTGGLPGLGLFVALIAVWMRAVSRAGRRQAWPLVQVITAYGLLWSVLGLFLLSPVVHDPLSGVIITAVWALGVAASLDSHQSSSAGAPPATSGDEPSSPSRVPLRIVDGGAARRIDR
ncbi:MraY family glycosyltransferase [Spiribacter curvatus]|uniref:MraY family glycosyltransferase n=1 Tax=Spiribacter curvatus TaxID=1335757 RepID=UPI00040B01D3|nr:MraY family glycosyltransferase [Spiribacter curvatus]